MKMLIMSSLLSLFFGPFSASALSCLGWSSAPEIAQSENALVAKVTTLKKNPQTSEALMSVDKVFVGDASIKTIEFGPDEMGYGNSARNVGESWVGLFYVSDEGRVYDVACGVGSIDITGEDQYSVAVSHEATLTVNKKELVAYLNGSLVPTMTDIQCSYYESSSSNGGLSFEFRLSEAGEARHISVDLPGEENPLEFRWMEQSAKYLKFNISDPRDQKSVEFVVALVADHGFFSSGYSSSSDSDYSYQDFHCQGVFSRPLIPVSGK